MVKIFTKNNCIQCKFTERMLDEHHIKYDDINLDDHPDQIDYVKSLGYAATPVVVTPNESWSGFQPDKLKTLFN